jgi:hypothetical protein
MLWLFINDKSITSDLEKVGCTLVLIAATGCRTEKGVPNEFFGALRSSDCVDLLGAYYSFESRRNAEIGNECMCVCVCVCVRI